MKLDKSQDTAMNMNPNDLRTKVSTSKSSGTQLENGEAWIARIQVLTMKETTSKAHMRVHTNKESRENQSGRKPGPKRAWASRPGPAGLGRLAQPTPGPVRRPFALGVHLFIASSSVRRHIKQIILPTPSTRKPPPQDEGESWMSSSQGSTPTEGRKQEEDSKPLS
jgi:hypothetical protein